AIISDYSMPGMDGIELLKSVRARYGDVPFILFTGRGREEVVIAAINNGADFYIQKGGDPKAQFAELQHKIRKAIERRQALDSAKDSEQRLSDIINFLPDATFVIDRSGHVIAWNRAIEEMTGVAAADMLGKGDFEYAIPFYGTRRPILVDLIYESEQVIAKNYEHIIREKDVLIADTTLPRPQGRLVTLVGKASPLYNRQGEIVGAIESIRDITDRKRAEEEMQALCEQLTASQEELQTQYRVLADNEQALRESEARFRELAELLPQIIFEMDTRFRLTFLNRQANTALGYSPEDIMQGVDALSLIDPSEHVRVRENIRKLIAGEPFEQREYTILRRDGSKFLALIYANPVCRDGNLTGFRGVVIDITDRLKAEEALHDSEKNYRLLVEVNRDIIYSLSPDGTILFISPQTMNQLGYRADELVGHNFHEFIHPGDSEILSRHMQEHFNTGAPFSSDQFRVLRKDGTYRWYEDKSIYTTDSQGRQIITGTIADITDRKAAEDELRKSELRLKYMLGFYRMAGKSEAELLDYAVEGAGVVTGSPLGYLAFLNEDESELTMYSWSRTALKECSMREKPVVYRTEKTGLWGEAVRQRRPVITNDYQAENPAKKGYPAGHPHITRHMNIPVTDRDHIVIVSGVANKSTDYTEDDARELTILMQGLWQVIKRKRAEEAQQESEARFRLLIEASPVPIVVSRDGSLIYCNIAFSRLEGTEDPMVLQGRDLLSFIAPEFREKVAGYIRAREKGEPAPRYYEAVGMRSDGTRFPYEISVAVIPLSDGPATMAFINDITDRRRAEEELKAAYEQLAASEEELRGQFGELLASEQRIRESEERYRTLIEHSRDGFFIIQEGRLVFYNRGAFNSLTGYNEQELVGRTLSELVAPEDYGRLMKQLQDRQEGKPVPDTLEFHLLHRDGKSRTLVRSHASMGTYQGNRALMGSLTDITEDRRRENTLRESEERYRNFIANTTEGIFRIDFSEPVRITQPRDNLASDIHDRAVFGEVNVAFAAMYGLDPEEMIGKPVREIVPNYGGKMADLLMTPDGNTVELEEREFTPAGEQIYIVDRYFSVVQDGLLNR
ncbi:MAG: PAS domain S-box protein, partial [Methanoregulaceae archaeon]|nr:PAS domain S-box protein [Methanoregulaceae archaeon]